MTVLEDDRVLSEAMAASLAGDELAYQNLLLVLAKRLRAYFRRRLPMRLSDHEDLVQETLIAVHTKRHTYDPQQPLAPWVFAIASYKLIDWHRRHGRREALHEPVEDWQDVLADEHAAADPTAALDIRSLLAALPAKQREPIRLVKLEGLSVVEASAQTGLSVSAVKVGIHRGLKALAARIRSRGEG